MAEGTPLLRVHTRKSIESSNLSLSANFKAYDGVARKSWYFTWEKSACESSSPLGE